MAAVRQEHKTFRAIEVGDGGDGRWAANHQHLPVTPEQEQALGTQERLRAIRAAGTDVAAMLRPPLYRRVGEDGLRTLYTARYQPAEGRVTYYWPGESWQQSFADFTPGSAP